MTFALMLLQLFGGKCNLPLQLIYIPFCDLAHKKGFFILLSLKLLDRFSKK